MTGEIGPVEECIVELFDHLGIEQAHFAAGRLVRGDWHGLATKHPERIASLTLISPQLLDPGGARRFGRSHACCGRGSGSHR